MLNVTEIAANAEERVLTGFKAGQNLVLDSLKNAMTLADRVMPENLSGRIEDRVEGMPSAAPLVESAFGFAEKLLEAQREFVGEVIEIFQPAVAPQATGKKDAEKAA